MRIVCSNCALSEPSRDTAVQSSSRILSRSAAEWIPFRYALEVCRACTDNRLHSEDQAREDHAGEAILDVEDVSAGLSERAVALYGGARCGVEHASDAVTDKVRLYAQSLLLDVSLDRVANDSDWPVRQRRLDADLNLSEQVNSNLMGSHHEGLLADLAELSRLGCSITNDVGSGAVAVEALQVDRDVNVHDVTRLQRPRVRYAVAENLPWVRSHRLGKREKVNLVD